MAIKLGDKPNTEPVSTNYPYGQIKDKTSSTPGTPLNKAVYGDFHQFFEKLMDEANITHNGLPDNAGDGFQLYQALLKVMESEDWNKTTLYTAADDYLYFRKGKDNMVYVTGALRQSGTPKTLPTGYRPAAEITFSFIGIDNSGDTLVGTLTIATNGNVTGNFDIGAGSLNIMPVNCSFKAA